jgi:hypothetical protein
MSEISTFCTLKRELKHLASIFDENHDRFQFSSKTADEFSCTFKVSEEEKFDFKANILVSCLIF